MVNGCEIIECSSECIDIIMFLAVFDCLHIYKERSCILHRLIVVDVEVKYVLYRGNGELERCEFLAGVVVLDIPPLCAVIEEYHDVMLIRSDAT